KYNWTISVKFRRISAIFLSQFGQLIKSVNVLLDVTGKMRGSGRKAGEVKLFDSPVFLCTEVALEYSSESIR
uniref:hypothetical protein n=1 Tax=Idiomarina sp. TaxID=1874361 RepID=UPI00258E7598